MKCGYIYPMKITIITLPFRPELNGLTKPDIRPGIYLDSPKQNGILKGLHMCLHSP